MEAALDMVVSSRLVDEGFARAPGRPRFPDEGRLGNRLSTSFSFPMVIFFGLEKSFIFDFSLPLPSFSGTKGGRGGGSESSVATVLELGTGAFG